MKINHNKVYIAFGSNLRSYSYKSTEIFFHAIEFRLRLMGLKVKRKSHLWKSAAIPYSCGPIFYNCVLECTLLLSYKPAPEKLLKDIENLEKKLGKKFKGENKQRTIDIDILDFHGKISSSHIYLPHPRMHLRKFVLYPLSELDRHWCHPVLKKSCTFLISKIKNNQFLKKRKMFP